jgi:hypothetical protein
MNCSCACANRGETMRTTRRRVWLDLRSGTHDDVREAIVQAIARLGLDHNAQVDFFAGALVAVALRPYWVEGRSPLEAHERLRADDAELADLVEAIAPVLLSRTAAREEQAAAVQAVEELLRHLP